jgi:hypothetical protein
MLIRKNVPICSQERHIVFDGRGGNDGITCTETGRYRVRFNVDGCAMADVFRQGKRNETERGQKVSGMLMLGFIHGQEWTVLQRK